MNKVILMGRLTRDPQVRYTQGQDSMAIARFTLAVDRRGRKQEGQQDADFPSCVAFGKSAEFVEKYVHQGTKIVLTGRIQTGSYTNKDNIKVYTTEGKLYAEGSRDTPCIIEVTAKADLTNYKITLNGEPYTIESLMNGETIVINGKTGKITKEGDNAFGSVDLWAFPKLQTGRNDLAFSTNGARVTVRYSPMWL